MFPSETHIYKARSHQEYRRANMYQLCGDTIFVAVGISHNRGTRGRTDSSNTQTEVPALENSGIRQEQSFLNIKGWL